jgi:hypothetical protein
MAKKKEILPHPPTGGALMKLDVSQLPQPRRASPLSYLVEQQMLDQDTEKPTKHRDPTLNTPLAKSILNTLNSSGQLSIERLAFERDPTQNYQYAGLYRPKRYLAPDALLKRVSIQDDLVAAIVLARCNHLASFGRLPPDRFSKGFKIEPQDDLVADLDDAKMESLQKRIDGATSFLLNCGKTKGVDQLHRCSFSEYLFQSTRNAVVVGRIATEVIRVDDGSGNLQIHSFRPVDASTIVFAQTDDGQGDKLREEAKNLIEELKSKKKKLKAETRHPKDYAWVQVIDGRPVQIFSKDEMLVHNFYPVTDYELEGYPLTPLDTVLSAVTTHINITNHNKAYFQNGRAARGMLVIRSNDLNQKIIEAMRQQFNASINGVQNAWRMPVFGCGPEDEITWQPIDTGGRDQEFQYLADTNARVILSAFQMSPEELPGYQHLSRGTNNQSLAESNNEYKLTAARDVGLHPLVSQFEDFINSNILPLIDPEVARYCRFKMVGLDAETAEKESVRIQQDAPLHMTYSEILKKVEKEPIETEWGGDFPLNQEFQQIIANYLTFGEILERFFGRKGASQNPDLQFYQNPNWMNWQQAKQAQAEAQAAAQQQGQPGQGQAPGDQGGGELDAGIDQLMEAMGKSEGRLPPNKKRLKALQRAANKHLMDQWEAESRKTLSDILDIAEIHAPNSKK